jgi:hypothetical protein
VGFAFVGDASRGRSHLQSFQETDVGLLGVLLLGEMVDDGGDVCSATRPDWPMFIARAKRLPCVKVSSV